MVVRARLRVTTVAETALTRTAFAEPLPGVMMLQLAPAAVTRAALYGPSKLGSDSALVPPAMVSLSAVMAPAAIVLAVREPAAISAAVIVPP